jgi:hypothetical protein
MNEISQDFWGAVVGIIGTALGAVVTVLITQLIEQRRTPKRKALALWRVTFDRPAFKGRYMLQSDQRAFDRAIAATLKAVTTGVLVDSGGTVLGQGLPYSKLRDAALHSVMDDIVQRLNLIRSKIPQSPAPPNPPASPDPSVAKIIDDQRDGIIERLNPIWKEAGLPELPIPTKVADLDSMLKLG